MALRINANTAALNARPQLSETEKGLRVTMKRLPTDYRINRAQKPNSYCRWRKWCTNITKIIIDRLK